MYLPATDTENTSIKNYLKLQLEAISNAGFGLTETDLRSRPTSSALSLAGLVKHALWVMTDTIKFVERQEKNFENMEGFNDSFTLGETESLTDLRKKFMEVKEQYLNMVEQVDLNSTIKMGPYPWNGLNEQKDGNLRYLFLHHIEEFARHAGHADIIREQIDGATSAPLSAAAESRPANDYVIPWQAK